MVINCNGLKGTSHCTEFLALLDFHILGCNSKLDKAVPTYSVFLPNYTVFRKDCDCHGGGVTVWNLRQGKVHLRMWEWNHLVYNITVGSSRAFHLAFYYRPPYSSQEVLEHFLDSFNSIFESSNHHPNIVAAGDFNLKGINLWTEVPSATNQATSAQHNRPLPFMEEFSLTHHVKCPTRPAFEKTLDLLFSLHAHIYFQCLSCIWN